MLENQLPFPTDYKTKRPGVYVITHPESNKCYVGSTGDLYQRKSEHVSDLRKGNHPNRPLQCAYNENDKLEFVCTPTATKEEAVTLEQAILDSYGNGEKLFNVATNATTPWKGLRHSEKSIEKMKETNKGVGLGSKKSPETIDKMKAAAKGRVIGEFMRTRSKEVLSKRISIDGSTYDSLAEASRILGISPSTIHQRLNSASDKFSNWHYT